MTTTPILLVDQSDAIVTLTLNRPEKLNALNEPLFRELVGAVSRLDQDPAVRVVILTGAGEKAFAAGADIEAMAEMTPAQAKQFASYGHGLGALIEQAHFPVIASVQGFALGGGFELALCCDFIYASDRAKIGNPEVGLGVIPGLGATQRLTRIVGAPRARELCMTGDVIGAEEAFRIGLVNAVVPHAELSAKVRAVAQKIASRAPLAIASAKRVILRGADAPLPSANELEATAFASLFGTQDQREGMRSFLEKRAPTFSGK